MHKAWKEIRVGSAEIVCALAVLGLFGATVIWNVNFSAIGALIIVIVLYAALRDVRMLWHTRKPGMPPAPAGKDASGTMQSLRGTDGQVRASID